MKPIETIKIKENQKDISKGQKIVAAVYLVTKHLSETEPIRLELRDRVLQFVCSVGPASKTLFSQIETLLGGAVFAGLISEKNSSIIVYEMKMFLSSLLAEDFENNLEQIFAIDHGALLVKKDTYKTHISHQPKALIQKTFTENTFKTKDARQDKILSFINDRKSAVIKDITTLFPDVSEKTIQRELNSLIDSGKITKRGSKRWSIYMAVNSLL